MSSLITQRIIARWSTSEFVQVDCQLCVQMRRAADGTSGFLFAEPRFLPAILPVVSHTPNRTEKIQLCVKILLTCYCQDSCRPGEVFRSDSG